MSYIERIAQAYSLIELTREELAYYARHILLPGIGIAGQRKLKAARVLVAGAGGLGCPVLQALASAGVGQLTVVDGDSVAVSNLSRQWLHTFADVGKNKAESAALSLRQLNPMIEVSAHSGMLLPENAQALIAAHDLVIDATDDLAARYCIDKACADLDKPWVHAALYRVHSQLTVFWAGCGATFRKLYPEPSVAPSCAGAGILGATASIAGNLQALEAIKLITGNCAPKVGQLTSLDANSLVLKSFQLPEVRQPLRISDVTSIPAGTSVSELQQALSIHQPVNLIDLRNCAQYEAGSIQGAIHYSAERILERGLPASSASHYILFCQEGSISRILVDALNHRHTLKLEHLEGGYAAWLQLSS